MCFLIKYTGHFQIVNVFIDVSHKNIDIVLWIMAGLLVYYPGKPFLLLILLGADQQ